MKRLILDFINRWKYWLGAAMAFQLFYTAVVLLESKTRFFTWILAVAAPALVSFDLQRGTGKVHSLLPIQRRVLARSYWVQGVLLPTVTTIAAILVAFILIGPFKPSAFEGLVFLPHFMMLSFALSGTLYLILTFMPLGPQSGLWNKVLAGVTRGSWILVFCAAIFLTTSESIQRWSTMAVYQRVLLVVGVVLGIVSYFTSPRLVRYRAAFRAGSHPARERTDARWITFPNRTASLLEPWFLTFAVASVALLIAGSVFLIFAAAHRWDAGEAMREILGKPGKTADYGIFMLAALALIPAIRPLSSLRLIRTLPLSGWRLTGVILSFPMLACYAASLVMLVLFIAAQDQHALARFARLFLFTTGLLFCAVALLVRYGPKFVFVGLWALFPVMGVTGVFWMELEPATETAVLPWIAAVLPGLFLSGIGIWLAHRALTRRSQTYRPSNLIGPGGMGR